MKSAINYCDLAKLEKYGHSMAGMVYFASDEAYFWHHGIYLIDSCLRHNPDWFIHVHLYDPLAKSLKYLQRLDRVSYSFETLDKDYFSRASLCLKLSGTTNEGVSRLKRICKTISAHDRNKYFGFIAKAIEFAPFLGQLIPTKVLTTYLNKTYYSCQRFVVLSDILRNVNIAGVILALDADSLFNARLPQELPGLNYDLSLRYRGEKSNQKYLAGAIMLSPFGARREFVGCLTEKMEMAFQSMKIEWGLDQILLSEVVPCFSWGLLDMRFCDLNFSDSSIIWLARGTTKHSQRYLASQQSSQVRG